MDSELDKLWLAFRRERAARQRNDRLGFACLLILLILTLDRLDLSSVGEWLESLKNLAENGLAIASAFVSGYALWRRAGGDELVGEEDEK